MNGPACPRLQGLAIALGLAVGGPALAQHQHQHTRPPAADHSDHSAHRPPADPHAAHQAAPAAPPSQHAHHSAAPTVPREPIPALTDADRAAAFPALDHGAMRHASALNTFLLAERLEVWDADRGRGQAWEASAWIGGDVHRLWLRSEGERQRGRTASSGLEVLYGRAVSPWWDLLAGVKHDFRPADSRSWAAFGVQGLAPYKFEVAATAYLGQSGQVQAHLELEYELLLTNRLILQPVAEAMFSLKDEPIHGIGRGLDSVETGLRLRYEFSRRFAPYLGLVHERVFGGSADYHRGSGETTRDTRLVAGVRMWF